MKRKANQESDEKSPQSKRIKKVFTGADFIILLSDPTSAFTGLATFIKLAEAHLKDPTEDDVVQSYCKSTSDCKEILDLLTDDKPKSQEIFQILESIRLILLRIFSDLKQFEIVAQAMAKKLVSSHTPTILRQTSIGNKSSHIKSALRLLTLLTSGSCSFKWGWMCKEVLSKVDFGHANWSAIVNRKDAKDTEDVKFCLMEFVCNLISSRNLMVLKMLVEAKNFMPTMFDCLHGDNYIVICKFLKTILDSVINNTSMTKTFKIRLFNEKALKSLCRLYNWTGPKSWQEMNVSKKEKAKSKYVTEEKQPLFNIENMTEEQELVRMHVHKVLIPLCSSFKHGIIFKDKSTPILSGQNPNHVITNLLQNLPQSFYKDPLLCDLSLRIFGSCSDQLHFFLGNLSFAGFLTPRVSRNWFLCCEFVTKVFQGQKFTPRTFPLFLLSDDPQKMGGNYVKYVLPPEEIWKKFMGGLLEERGDHIVTRCLNFVSVNLERLLEAKQLIKQQRTNNTKLYESNKHAYHEFESSFNEGLKKNLPAFGDIVRCMEDFIGSEKLEADEATEEKRRIAEVILKELPTIQHAEVVGKFLEVICNLSSLVDGESFERENSTFLEKTVEAIEKVVNNFPAKNEHEKKKSKKNKRRSISMREDEEEENNNGAISVPSLRNVKSLLLYFWKTISLRKIPLKMFVESGECGKGSILHTTLDLLARDRSNVGDNDDDDDTLKHVMLSDAFCQVLFECGAFASLDEIRSWVRNLSPMGRDEPKNYAKKCIRFLLSNLSKSVDEVVGDSKLSIFMKNALKQQQDKIHESYVDVCLCDIIATGVDPLSLSMELKSLMTTSSIGELSKTKHVLEFLTSDKLKKKSRDIEFSCPDVETSSDVRFMEYQLKMTCFVTSLELFKLSKINSQDPDMSKLNGHLDKLSAAIRKLNKLRGMENDHDEEEEKHQDENDEENVQSSTKESLSSAQSSKNTEIFNRIFRESCTFVFNDSYLQTFFMNQSASVEVLNEWFGSMAERLLQVLDSGALEKIFATPLEKVKKVLSDASDVKELKGFDDQFMKLVKSFSPLLPSEMVKNYCKIYILNNCKREHICESDVKILTEYGIKSFSGKCEVVEGEDLIRKASQYLSERIMSSQRLSDGSLADSFSFLLKFIRANPLQGVELLTWKKKKNSFFTHLISSSQTLKLNFIVDTMKIMPREHIDNLLKLISDWLENNREVWMTKENGNYIGMLVEFVRRSKGSDLTRDVGLCLWSMAIELVCQGGDLNEDSLESMNFVLTSIDAIFEMFRDKIISADMMETTSVNWGKFVKAGLKHYLMNKSFINILSSMVRQCISSNGSNLSIPPSSLQPSIPDVFNMVVGHSMFVKIVTLDSSSPEKGSVFRLLHALAVLSPKKCCTPNLVPLLFGAFSATLSTTDKCILSLLHMSEKNGADILLQKPYYWGQKAVDYQASKKVLFANVLDHGLNELLDQIDPKIMMDSALNFPFSNKLDYSSYVPQAKETLYNIGDQEASKLYDPCYFLPVFNHLLDKNTDCRKFVDKNCLALCIASLTSHEPSVRNLGSRILVAFRGHLEKSKFIDKQQIMYMLDALKNGIEGASFKLPSIVSVFLVRASNILLKPNHHMYMLINQFLLLKPAMDVHNVPEFYKLFFSSSLEHKKERAWVLEMLADGLRETKDFHICEKRKVFKCITTFYTSPLCDHANKVQILAILHNICLNSRSVVWNLVKKQGFLSWIVAAFFAFSGNLNKKWSTGLSAASQSNASVPVSLQVIMEKLVQILKVCWQAVHSSGHDGNKMDRNEKGEMEMEKNVSALSPTVLAEFLLTFEHLLNSNLCLLPGLRSNVMALLDDAKEEAQKTEKLFQSRGFIFPIPKDLL